MLSINYLTLLPSVAAQQDTRPQAQQPEYQPEPPPPPPQVTPRPTPAPTRPPAPVQTTGYNYPVPENPLPIRKVYFCNEDFGQFIFNIIKL